MRMSRWALEGSDHAIAYAQYNNFLYIYKFIMLRIEFVRERQRKCNITENIQYLKMEAIEGTYFSPIFFFLLFQTASIEECLTSVILQSDSATQKKLSKIAEKSSINTF